NADGTTATTSFSVSFSDVAPSVGTNNSSVSGSENTGASNSGSFSDFDDTVTMSVLSGPGSVTQSGTQSGNWSWSGAADESGNPYTLVIKATNADGTSATTSFTVSFTDVAPGIGADHPSVTVNEGQTASNTGTFADYDDSVTSITASVGSVTQSGSQSGTW